MKKKWKQTGKALHLIRTQELELTLEALAKLLGVTRQYLYQLEHGISRPSADVFQGILKLRKTASSETISAFKIGMKMNLGEDVYCQLTQTERAQRK